MTIYCINKNNSFRSQPVLCTQWQIGGGGTHHRPVSSFCFSLHLLFWKESFDAYDNIDVCIGVDQIVPLQLSRDSSIVSCMHEFHNHALQTTPTLLLRASTVWKHTCRQLQDYDVMSVEVRRSRAIVFKCVCKRTCLGGLWACPPPLPPQFNFDTLRCMLSDSISTTSKLYCRFASCTCTWDLPLITSAEIRWHHTTMFVCNY